ncbi:MAG: Ig-like domain-containing protein [Myxococcales bacterium]|nr:Ig-like domain-containing protein [Myxococcales bacterium]
MNSIRKCAASFLLTLSLVSAGCGGGTPPDTEPPTVMASSINAGATGVPWRTAITLEFSEPVDPAGIEGIARLYADRATALEQDALGRHPLRAELDAGGTTLTIRPLGPLLDATRYRLEVAGAVDLAGNDLAPYTLSFETATDVRLYTHDEYDGVVDHYYRTTFDAPLGGIRQTLYFGIGEDGQWDTSDDLIGAYTDAYRDATREELHSFTSAGADLLWWNEDDEHIAISRREFLADRTRQYRVDDPGANGIWGDEDDVAEDRTEVIYDAHGQPVSFVRYTEGPDGLALTADDVVYRTADYYFSDGFFIGSFSAETAGEDGEFGTGDDVGYARVVQLDADGVAVGSSKHSDVRRDGFPAYDDTTIASYQRYEHVDGEVVFTRIWSTSSAGEDGVFRTADDVPSSVSHVDLDSAGRPLRQVDHSVGDDGVRGTADDGVSRYTGFEYDADGVTRTERRYVAAGEDGVFFTSDDELRSVSEFEGI